MKPTITIDLRDYDFETLNGLAELACDELEHIRDCHPQYRADAVVIGEHQLKLLRLECYEQGMPEEDVRIMEPNTVCNLPVIVIWDDGTYRCPDCGELHEMDVG